MELTELIEHGADHPEQREAVGRILISKHKLDENLIEIRIYGSKESPGMYPINGYHYYLTDKDLAVKLITHFGHLIKRLHYNCDLNSGNKNEKIQLLKLINQKCSENLVEARFPIPYRIWMEKPFKNVKIVWISGYIKEPLRLKKRFPAMEELSLDAVDAFDHYYILKTYPNLKRLRSRFIGSDDLAIDLFRENRAINYLDIHNSKAFYFLQNIDAQRASLLETLFFYPLPDYPYQSADTMHFPNLDTFIIVDEEMFTVPRLPFSFSSLKNFTYVDKYVWNGGKFQLPYDWYKIIPNTDTLQTISVKDNKLSMEQLVDYSNRFSNLENLSFLLSWDLCDDKLIEFLTTTPTHIKTIEIARVPTNSSCDLAKKLSGKWNFKFIPETYMTNRHTLLLERNAI